MTVYIGWSGEVGRKTADILRRWLSAILSDSITFASDNDMGTAWRDALQQQLNTSDYALLCVTRENIQSSTQSFWLAYEAGILTAASRRIVPVLLDVSPAELIAPLRQFPCIEATEDDFWRLIQEMNTLNGKSPASLRRRYDLMSSAMLEELRELRNAQEQGAELPRKTTGERSSSVPERKADGTAVKDTRDVEKAGEELTELNRKMDSILAALGVNPPRTAGRKPAIAESFSGSAVG